MKYRILAIILNNRGLRPKDVINILHNSMDEEFRTATGGQVRHYLHTLKEGGLIYKHPKNKKYYVRDKEKVTAEVNNFYKGATPNNNNVLQTIDAPGGRGWAAFILTINPDKYLSQEQIYTKISRYIEVERQTARQWITRLRSYLEKHRFGKTDKYRPKHDKMGALMDIAEEQRVYVGATPYAPVPPREKPEPVPKPKTLNRLTVAGTVAPSSSQAKICDITKKPTLANARPATLHQKKEKEQGTLEEDKDPPCHPQTALQQRSQQEVQLNPLLFYDPNDHPRIRLSKKCRRYPLLPGHYSAIHGYFFSYPIVEADDMGTWVQYRAKGFIPRQHAHGTTNYPFYLFLKPNFLEIHLPPWEGYDPFRMDDEMEYVLDEVMETLQRQYGQPLTGPGRTDYSNQELEHYDYIKGRYLLELGAKAENKVAWKINPRVLKYADMSGARYREDKLSPDVGASTAHAKALQMQSEIFHEEFTSRAYEGVRDLQDRIEGIATKAEVNGLTAAMNRFADILEGAPKAPPAPSQRIRRSGQTELWIGGMTCSQARMNAGVSRQNIGNKRGR